MAEGVHKRFDLPVVEGTRDEHPLLEAHHVDDLTEAVNALSRLISKGAQQFQVSIDLQRKTIEVLAEIRDALTSDERPTKRARKK